jgi:hypothetical protein
LKLGVGQGWTVDKIGAREAKSLTVADAVALFDKPRPVH